MPDADPAMCALSFHVGGVPTNCSKPRIGARLVKWGGVGLWVNYCEEHRGVVDLFASDVAGVTLHPDQVEESTPGGAH